MNIYLHLKKNKKRECGDMKLINSKDINKILEDKSDPGDFFDFREEDLVSPCWQINIDKDRGDMVFLIDSKEITFDMLIRYASI